MITYDFPPKSKWGVASHVEILSSNLKKYYTLDVATKCENQNELASILSTEEADNHLSKSEYLWKDAYVDFEYLMDWNYLFARKIIKELNNRSRIPKIIHNHNWMTFPAALSIKSYYGSSLISTLHFLEKQYNNVQETPSLVDLQGIYEIERKIMKFSDKLIVFGKNHKNFVLNNYHVYEKKLVVIPSGLDLNKFKKYRCSSKRSNKYFTINFVGRLVHEKGIIELVSAVNQISQTYPFVRLNIFGDGYLYDQIIENQNIKKHGFVKGNRLFQFHKQADAFCLPSYTETFGYATLEAMACGLPIVTSRGKNVEKLLEDHEGLFIDLKDGNHTVINEEQLIGHLIKLINFKEERIELSSRSLLAAKRYSLRNMINLIRDLYDK